MARPLHLHVRRFACGAALALAVLVLPACAPGGDDADKPVAEVVRVIDGDTIDVRQPDGERQRVRLIGIDTPESSTLRSGHVECGSGDATRATEELARRWPRVTLTADPGQDEVDRYGRLLAYVAPVDEPGTTFQEELLRDGWAKVYVFRGDPFERVDDFRAAARAAKSAGAGVWRQCGGDFRRASDG